MMTVRDSAVRGNIFCRCIGNEQQTFLWSAKISMKGAVEQAHNYFKCKSVFIQVPEIRCRSAHKYVSCSLLRVHCATPCKVLQISVPEQFYHLRPYQTDGGVITFVTHTQHPVVSTTMLIAGREVETAIQSAVVYCSHVRTLA